MESGIIRRVLQLNRVQQGPAQDPLSRAQQLSSFQPDFHPNRNIPNSLPFSLSLYDCLINHNILMTYLDFTQPLQHSDFTQVTKTASLNKSSFTMY